MEASNLRIAHTSFLLWAVLCVHTGLEPFAGFNIQQAALQRVYTYLIVGVHMILSIEGERITVLIGLNEDSFFNCLLADLFGQPVPVFGY